MFFILLGVASASDVNNVSSIESSNDNSDILSSNVDLENELSSDMKFNETLSVNNDDKVSSDEGSDEVQDNHSSDKVVANKQPSFVVVSPATIIKGDSFQVKLLDENGTAMSGKKVSISFNGRDYTKTTNSNGIASLKITAHKDSYNVKFTFKENGTTVKGSTKLLVLTKSQSSISGSAKYIAYRGFDNPFTIKLTGDGFKLANKKVRFKINGKNYYRTTNSKGKASLNIKLAKGTYKVKYYFNGEKNIDSAYGKSKIIVKKGMPTKISKANSVTYYHKVKAPFKVKVVDARGNPVKGKVVFKVNNGKFKRNINSKGIAKLNINLKAGSYKLKYAFYKTSIYKEARGSKMLYVKSLNKCKNNGYWIFGYDMNNVNLNTLAKTSTKHIFLNYAAVSKHGKSAVESFIKKAKNKGISVHIWMQIFYDGSWVSPVYSDGSYKYSFFNSKIKEAKSYAKLKGVAGIHLDYIRFPGDAYNHRNGVAAINYFTKELCNAVHKINSKLIVSAALMPEPDSLKHYYGQDVQTMSKYLDVLIPMIYKGNYLSGTSWIKSTTATFVKMSKGAEVWTGIQSYRSDDDVTPLSSSELLRDYRAAANGGATGVISFRWGISKLVDFNKI